MHKLSSLRKSITRKNLGQAEPYEKAIEDLLKSAYQLSTRQIKEHEDHTLEEYVRSRPSQASESRKSFYIQKLGSFSPEQLQAIDTLIEFIESFYGLNVIIREDIQENLLIEDAFIQKGELVYLESEYILHNLISGFVPRTAVALICITSHSLYSVDDQCSVLGHALIRYRAALWTIQPFDFSAGINNSTTELEAFLKIAAHEIGHIFSLQHCEQYECIMGIVDSYFLESYPATYCPTCMAKLFWNLDVDGLSWLQKQRQYWLKFGHAKNSKLYEKLIYLWQKKDG